MKVQSLKERKYKAVEDLFNDEIISYNEIALTTSLKPQTVRNFHLKYIKVGIKKRELNRN